MNRVRRATARDPLTATESFHAVPNVQHDTRARVAERQRLIEPVIDCVPRREDSFALHLIPGLADQIWTRARLFEQIFRREIHNHSLRPGRNEAGRALDENAVARYTR